MCRRGAASSGTWSRPGANVPVAAMTPAPATSATISGGNRSTSAGKAPASRNARVMGAAIQGSLRKACTQSSPNCRNTPATMPMTIGIGNACMARRTHPVAPRISISRPVAMKAPMICANVKWPSAGPTRTVPGMVQKNASGWR